MGLERRGPPSWIPTQASSKRLYPRLTAVRLLEEIRAAGYRGGYTQLKEYVRKVRPRPPPVAASRRPGHQLDFADFRLPWGKRYAFLVVLGYSRSGCSSSLDRRCHVFEGLEAAFTSLVACLMNLFDQMKAVIG